MAARSKKNSVQRFQVRHTLGDELFDLSPPPLADDALSVMSGVEAGRLLRLGQALRGKRIEGDLIIGQEDLQNPFEFELDGGRRAVLANLPRPAISRIPANYRIEIEGCFVEGKLILAGLWFQDSVSISSTTFQEIVDFQFSQFDRLARFHCCRFLAAAKFADASFMSGALFGRTRFDDLADFYHTTFHDGLNFGNAVFQSQSNFSESRFNEAVFFKNATFEKIADFTDTQFRRQADFIGSTFRYVNFTNAEFQRLDLKWEQIARGKLLFGDVVLEGIDPSKPSIETREFKELFKHRLDAPLDQKHRQYDILKAILTKQGDYVSADACFYEWKQVERRKSPLGWNPEKWIVKGFHYLNWLSCGYGVKPLRTLFFGLVIVLLFAGTFTLIDSNADVHWNRGPKLSIGKPSTNLSTALIGRLDFSFRAFMNFTPIENKGAPAIHALFLVERLLGWLTLFLFITTYTRIMLR
jgi:hypothetical protein